MLIIVSAIKIGATARQDLCAAPTEWTVLCSPHTAEYLTLETISCKNKVV